MRIFWIKMTGFLKRTINIFRNRLFGRIFLVLLVPTFASYGKTLQMYFWVDDWAMAYKVLWSEEVIFTLKNESRLKKLSKDKIIPKVLISHDSFFDPQYKGGQ